MNDVEALHREHWDRLWRLAVLLTGDGAAAEDVVQDAFARLLRVGRAPAPGTELAYLRKTVVNLTNSRWRRVAVARRHAPVLAAAQPRYAPEPEEPSRSADVRAAVAALPTQQRACVVLHYFEGLSDVAIAHTLGISAGSVKTHLHRARTALATRLEEHR